MRRIRFGSLSSHPLSSHPGPVQTKARTDRRAVLAVQSTFCVACEGDRSLALLLISPFSLLPSALSVRAGVRGERRGEGVCGLGGGGETVEEMKRRKRKWAGRGEGRTGSVGHGGGGGWCEEEAEMGWGPEERTGERSRLVSTVSRPTDQVGHGMAWHGTARRGDVALHVLTTRHG